MKKGTKKRKVFSILLVCLMALGLVMTLSSCELLGDLFGMTATVTVRNSSTYGSDYTVAVGVYDRSYSVLKEGTMNRNSTWECSSLKSGTDYQIMVIDANDNIYTSPWFSVSGGQTRSFTYNGNNIR